MKKKNSKGLVQHETEKVTTEMIMSHPMVKEMAARLENVQNLLQALPEAIGRAVAQATAPPPPKPAPYPGQTVQVAMPPAVKCGRVIELRPQQMAVDGQTYDLPPKPREVPPYAGPSIRKS